MAVQVFQLAVVIIGLDSFEAGYRLRILDSCKLSLFWILLRRCRLDLYPVSLQNRRQLLPILQLLPLGCPISLLQTNLLGIIYFLIILYLGISRLSPRLIYPSRRLFIGHPG